MQYITISNASPTLSGKRNRQQMYDNMRHFLETGFIAMQNRRTPDEADEVFATPKTRPVHQSLSRLYLSF